MRLHICMCYLVWTCFQTSEKLIILIDICSQLSNTYKDSRLLAEISAEIVLNYKMCKLDKYIICW